jgi:uncharacterized protein (DUF1697 family)
MTIWVALLRGVNVSGAGKLPMAELREMLTGLGLQRVETYIQSGNAVFDSDLDAPVLEAVIREAIAARFGFAPETFVLAAGDIGSALTDHPFAVADPARVHVFFLRETPDRLDEAAMRLLAAEGDGWALAPGRFTLHTPAGIGRSKLADKLHKFLQGQMTARNLRTVAALHELARRH